MCWLTKAWPSTTSVIVFFRSAPSARIGRSVGRRDCARELAAGAAQHYGTESAGACDGIVHPSGDRTLPIRMESAIPARRCTASSSS